MNFSEYIGMTPAEFTAQYVETGYVSVQHHNVFPLTILTYSRKTVQENKWDHVTSRCRGIVINMNTGEIISRPFEKFFNYGMAVDNPNDHLPLLTLPSIEPVIWEKLDGFMATLYTWQGVDYIASKGSFNSVHAKWATAWLRKKFGESLGVPAGYTAVFEGLHRDLRIVIDYKDRQELVLLALINNETGEEFTPGAIYAFADSKGLSRPVEFNMTLEAARIYTMAENEYASEEGYVLTWYRDGKPPFRLKMKFIEYLRLHRMVTGVSPKRIWEVLATNQSSELDEYLKQSTPWFSAFVQKWMKALTAEYKRIEKESLKRYIVAKLEVGEYFCDISDAAQPGIVYKNSYSFEFSAIRKQYALRFTTPENKPYSGVLFAMLDGKDVKSVIWKMLKPLTSGKNPMIDAHNT